MLYSHNSEYFIITIMHQPTQNSILFREKVLPNFFDVLLEKILEFTERRTKKYYLSVICDVNNSLQMYHSNAPVYI